MQEKLRHAVWASGCRSWYLTPDGRNPTLWPGFTVDYWLRTRRGHGSAVGDRQRPNVRIIGEAGIGEDAAVAGDVNGVRLQPRRETYRPARRTPQTESCITVRLGTLPSPYAPDWAPT